jgi:pimeloyl-ACP methyl ester carboxylesterase
VLVGHSLGGGTALQAALQHPRAFKGLVLVAPTPAAGISSYVSHEQLESVISPTGDQLATFAGAAFHRQPDQQLFYCLLVTVQVASPRHVEGAMRSQHAFDVTGQLGGTAAQADPRPVAFAHARERAQPAHPIRPAGRPDRRLDPLLDAIVVHRRSAASCPCPSEYSTDSRPPPAHEVKITGTDPDSLGVHTEQHQPGGPDHYVVNYDVWNHRDSLTFAKIVRTSSVTRAAAPSTTTPSPAGADGSHAGGLT